MNEWISVEDKLPENGQHVLLISSSWEHPKVLRYSNAINQHRFIDGMSGRWFWYPERMHWMKLPEPPVSVPKTSTETNDNKEVI